MNCNIAVIKGDGIGPEVVTQAMKVLDAIGEKYGHTFCYEQLLMGGCSIDAHGVPLTDEAVERAKASDAVLLGSIGGNTSTSPLYKLPPDKRVLSAATHQHPPGISFRRTKDRRQVF